jgi:iron complex outermembrane recepter protein
LGQEAGHQPHRRRDRNLAPGVGLILDGGVRRKFQQAQFFNYITFDPFFNPTFDVAGATSMNYLDTLMTTSSFTPRFDVHHNLFGTPGRLLTGVDIYNTQYNSDRPTAPGLMPVHAYDIRQLTTGFYAINTSTVRTDTDISFGGRLQRNGLKAQDVYNAAPIRSHVCHFATTRRLPRSTVPSGSGQRMPASNTA